MPNTLYYGDNLPILRALPSQSIDLIYLDPPFNSSRNYNVLFKDQSNVSSDAQITAFADTWSWGPSAEQALTDIIQTNPGVVDDLLDALKRIIGPSPMLAYLVMMAARLLELHRILKPTGSLYLHCDPVASHYLKVVLDTIFGFRNYQSEITWKRTSSHGNVSVGYGSVCDTIFYYTKSSIFTWNQVYIPYSEDHVNKNFNKIDKDGRRFTTSDLRNPGYRPNLIYNFTASNGKIYKPHPNGWAVSKDKMEQYDREGRLYYPETGNRLRLKRYLDETPGEKVQNLWDDIPPISAQAAERLGYPTQKPLALLERIIQASSNPGDLVLDPFCGCGTAIAAAEKLNRQWIGIDITYLAITLIEGRMKKMFPGLQFKVEGKPADLASARDLANRDRYQFQWWALSLIAAKPVGAPSSASGKGKLSSAEPGLGPIGKKGKDHGIDGIINYIDNPKQDLKRVIVQVKSGHVNASTLRDLHGVLQREASEIGVLITLESPTKDMISEAASAGYYKSDFWQKSYPRLQTLTIEQLLSGAAVQMPPETGTFLAAQKVKKAQAQQGTLDL